MVPCDAGGAGSSLRPGLQSERPSLCAHGTESPQCRTPAPVHLRTCRVKSRGHALVCMRAAVGSALSVHPRILSVRCRPTTSSSLPNPVGGNGIFRVTSKYAAKKEADWVCFVGRWVLRRKWCVEMDGWAGSQDGLCPRLIGGMILARSFNPGAHGLRAEVRDAAGGWCTQGQPASLLRRALITVQLSSKSRSQTGTVRHGPRL